MTSLRLFETDGGLIAPDRTSHLFETPPRSQRYRRSRWPYDLSVVLHAIALVSVAILARYFTPPPPPAPAPPLQNVASVFVLPKSSVESSPRSSPQRRSSRTPHPKQVPAAIKASVVAAPAPAPVALEDSRVADTRSIADEKPRQSAFDPPIPVGDARLKGRRGDPGEAGLGSATVNVRGSPSPAAEIRPGGLGEGSIREAGNGGSPFSVRPGFGDASGGGG